MEYPRLKFVLSVYCNSLLATLNARRSIRGVDDEQNGSFSLRGVSKNSTAVGSKKSNGISIKIDTTQEYARDHLDLGLDQDVSRLFNHLSLLLTRQIFHSRL